ncbi:MAG: CooT family nickel-binding protein [Deltaproteobacteria bacterium]|nr:CooT family nickel-binding protein [Deltaproteobacteria bacterium]
MCESKAYLIKDGKEEIILDSVDSFEVMKDIVKLQNIFGEEKEFKAKIKKMSLIDHKIILEAIL